MKTKKSKGTAKVCDLKFFILCHRAGEKTTDQSITSEQITARRKANSINMQSHAINDRSIIKCIGKI